MLKIDESTIEPFYCDSLFLKNPQIGVINVHTQSDRKLTRVFSPSLIETLLFKCLVEEVGVIRHVKRNDFGVAFSIVCVEQSSTDTNTSNGLIVFSLDNGPIQRRFIHSFLKQLLTSPGCITLERIS
jgi:hypothetical protein